MGSFCPLAGFGGHVVELPYFFRRLNAHAASRRFKAWKLYIQARRLQALRGAPTLAWHPDAYRQPGEVE